MWLGSFLFAAQRPSTPLPNRLPHRAHYQALTASQAMQRQRIAVLANGSPLLLWFHSGCVALRCSGGSRLWPLPPLAATRAGSCLLSDCHGSPAWATTPAAPLRSRTYQQGCILPPVARPPPYTATPPRVATSPDRRAAVRARRALRRRRCRRGGGVPMGRR